MVYSNYFHYLPDGPLVRLEVVRGTPDDFRREQVTNFYESVARHVRSTAITPRKHGKTQLQRSLSDQNRATNSAPRWIQAK